MKIRKSRGQILTLAAQAGKPDPEQRETAANCELADTNRQRAYGFVVIKRRLSRITEALTERA